MTLTAEALRPAIRALLQPGGVVVYPTETVYGLGGRAGDGASARRIATLKGRDPGRLLVLCEDPPLPGPRARILAEAFWPGPLSLVVPAWPAIAPEVGAADGTVGVRPPVHPVARALVAAVGPLTSTSANRSGQAPPRSLQDFHLPVDACLDVGPLPPSPPSTVVLATTGEVLRPGAVPAERIRAVLARRT